MQLRLCALHEIIVGSRSIYLYNMTLRQITAVLVNDENEHRSLTTVRSTSIMYNIIQ